MSKVINLQMSENGENPNMESFFSHSVSVYFKMEEFSIILKSLIYEIF